MWLLLPSFLIVLGISLILRFTIFSAQRKQNRKHHEREEKRPSSESSHGSLPRIESEKSEGMKDVEWEGCSFETLRGKCVDSRDRGVWALIWGNRIKLWNIWIRQNWFCFLVKIWISKQLNSRLVYSAVPFCRKLKVAKYLYLCELLINRWMPLASDMWQMLL